MKTALIIVKRPVIVLPSLAKLCRECYAEQDVQWRCIIDLGERLFKHKIKSDFLVRRDECDLPKLAIDLARAEGKCDRVVLCNFGDRCEFNYCTKIKDNCVGLSHMSDCEGNLLEENGFIQMKSFVCYSCSVQASIEVDKGINVFIAKEATPKDLDCHNLDCK